MKDLPTEKWETLPLGELCEFRRGLTYKKGDEVEAGGTPVLRANNVDLARGELELKEIRYIDPAIEVPKPKKVVAGSLLICTASGSKKHLGKTALIEDDMDFAFGGFMGLLVPRPTILPRYLQWLLRSDAYWSFIDGLSDGANINNLKFKQLAEFPVPLPPLEEQKRIVAVLDEAFEGLARARAHAEANLQNARELFERELDAALEALAAQYGTTQLGSVSDFRNGFAFKSARFKARGEPVVRISNIQDGKVDEAKMVYTDPNDYSEDLTRYAVEPGDLLIAMSGATTGKVGFNTTGKVLLQNQRVGRFCPTEKLDLRFLYYFLGTKVAEHLSISAGAAQPNLSTKQVNEIEMPVPPVGAQEEFVQQVELLNDAVDALKDNYTQSLQDLDDLRQSLLQKAFAGKLT